MPLETTRREVKRKKIFSAAFKVMGEQGYKDATVRAITEEAGAAHGIFYYYFESKDDLVEKMIETGVGRLLDAYERVVVPHMSAVRMFRAIALTTYDEAYRHPDFMKFVFSEMWHQSEDWRLILDEEIGEVTSVFAEIIERGQEDGVFDPELNISFASQTAFSTICTTAASHYDGAIEGDSSGIKEQTVDFVYRGLTGQVANG